MIATRSKVDAGTARALAVEAQVDPRTILRELREPGSVKTMAGERARTALLKRGLLKHSESEQKT